MGVTPETFEALAKLVTHLREKGVRSFKGILPYTDGVHWELDLVFERGSDPRRKDDE
jgi:hypothetical protein